MIMLNKQKDCKTNDLAAHNDYILNAGWLCIQSQSGYVFLYWAMSYGLDVPFNVYRTSLKIVQYFC